MKKILMYIRFIPICIFGFIYSKNDRLIMDVKRWTNQENISLNRDLAVLLFILKNFVIYLFIETVTLRHIDYFAIGLNFGIHQKKPYI